MRYKLFAALLCLSLLFITCDRNKDILSTVNITATDSKQNNYENAKLSSVAYSGLYVDNFFLIYGDTAKENKLLRYCTKYGFNAITLYDMNIVIAKTSNHPKVAKFIRKARTQYNIQYIAAVKETNTPFNTNITTYNAKYTNVLDRFDYFNLEKEWWNYACNFTTYNNSYLKKMYTLGRSYSPTIKSETYIGWFENPLNQDLYQATEIIRSTDRILVHDYELQPSYSYVEDRLDVLNRAAINLNKTVNIVIIFSAEPVFMQNYYKTHTLTDTYDNFMVQYNLKPKSNINIIGYQIFCYTFIQQVIK